MKPHRSSIKLTVAQHVEGARNQLAFADSLRRLDSTPTVLQWAITALFYSAVHATRGYLLAVHDVRVIAHYEMRNHFEDYPNLKRHQVAYQHLKQQSEACRYYLKEDFTWLDFEYMRTLASRILDFYLAKIDEKSI